MATYTGAPKILQSVSVTSSAASATLYSVDPDRYVLANVVVYTASTVGNSSTFNVRVASRELFSLNNQLDFEASGSPIPILTGVVIGPSQSITWAQSSSDYVVHVSGVEFVNQS